MRYNVLMLPQYFITDQWGQPIPESDLLLWAKWFADHQRTLRVSYVEGLFKVSTIFLGIDYGFHFETSDPLLYKPTLWETMSFSTGTETSTLAGKAFTYHPYLDQRRYTSREDALAGHQEMVDELYASLADLTRALAPDSQVSD